MAGVDGLENAGTLFVHVEPHATGVDKSGGEPAAGIGTRGEDPRVAASI